ncbi:AraC family transcriptional regulator [Novosphingobium nitrogenifigens DSM 19370]|uniref:AraC family transcriptional regulator n=1 Tax=Novosphingobium nitrogenifigens DSM 19370 TaxID=983920 RepID=F1Z3B5_9SPHN|nr:AraC family transcriptional regulator [Novosphingobium nitrogenifigens]EGD60898.1 AraC family transcriptional regulator [Novosphingobium nitrogenifigens DSM 19370]
MPMYQALHSNADGFALTLAGAASHSFLSKERDEVRSYVGRMYCEHSFDLVNPRGLLTTDIAHLRCGSVTLTEMSYGADVIIDAGRLEHFYLVQIPVAGRAGLTLGGEHGVYGPGRASVQHPQVPLEMHWSGDCRKVVLRCDRAGFERFVEAFLGRPLRSHVRFEPWFDLASPLGARLVDQMQCAIAMVRNGARFEPCGANALLERHLENTMMTALLFLQPHDLSEELGRSIPAADPLPVRRVREYLHEHAHDPIDMADIGKVAGIPLRTLHHQFRQTLGVTPMQLLRDIRLERVRRELMAPGETTNVTQVAMHWGFEHLGRFALAYRQRFGETPRETLRRQR